MEKFYTRMGDGSVIELSESELKRDLEEGTKDAAERAKSPLSPKTICDAYLIFISALIKVLVWREEKK